MSKKILFTFVGILFFWVNINAQESWSLEKCVNYAMQNNLGIKQAQYNIRTAELSLDQNKASRLPSLNASANAGFQFGRTIDPTTNSFNNQKIGFNSYNLNASAVLFNGNAIKNGIKKSNIDLKIAKFNGDEVSNNLGLSVANAYLSILLADEQVNNAKKRLELSQQQLDQTDKLIRAGSLPENNRLDFLSRIAQDEQMVIEAQNQEAIAYLNLKQLLELDADVNFRISKPSVEIPAKDNPGILNIEEVYTTALGFQPQIKSASLQIESAKVGESISKAALLPRLVIFGGLSSNYSSLAKDFDNPNLDNIETFPLNPRPILVNGIPAEVTEFGIRGVTFDNKKYFDQLNENFGQNVGLSINIPIYNNNLNKINIERAQLNSLNAQVSNQQIKNRLKSDIQLSLANARSGKRAHEAALKSVTAAEAAYSNAEKRFNLGAISTFEFTTARNTLDQAIVSEVRAKYQYIFYLKVIDFYLGKQIKF